jgi:hypothetical protein
MVRLDPILNAGFDGIEPPTGMTQVATLSVAHADIGASAMSRLLSLVETTLVDGTTLARPPGGAGRA